jgi:hypothetical protein
MAIPAIHSRLLTRPIPLFMLDLAVSVLDHSSGQLNAARRGHRS